MSFNLSDQKVSKINSKEEFFKNKNDRWQLEKNFYQNLKEIYDINMNTIQIYVVHRGVLFGPFSC